MARELLTVVMLIMTAANSIGSNYAPTGAALQLERALPLADHPAAINSLRLHDRCRNSRLLQQQKAATAGAIQLRSSDEPIIGLYYAKIKMGTPPQDFYVQVDTGSDISWVYCIECRVDCPPHGRRIYSLADSSTTRQITCNEQICRAPSDDIHCSGPSDMCNFSIQYGDMRTASGSLFVDHLQFETVLNQYQTVNTSADAVFVRNNGLIWWPDINVKSYTSYPDFGPN